MRKKIMNIFIIALCIPFMVQAQTVTETDIPCADGEGIIVKGAIKGEYCYIKKDMDWWNATAYCDALGMQLPELSEDCGCSVSGASCENKSCPNFSGWNTTISQGIGGGYMWFQNPCSTSTSYRMLNGNIDCKSRTRAGNYGHFRILCKMK